MIRTARNTAKPFAGAATPQRGGVPGLASVHEGAVNTITAQQQRQCQPPWDSCCRGYGRQWIGSSSSEQHSLIASKFGCRGGLLLQS